MGLVDRRDHISFSEKKRKRRDGSLRVDLCTLKLHAVRSNTISITVVVDDREMIRESLEARLSDFPQFLGIIGAV